MLGVFDIVPRLVKTLSHKNSHIKRQYPYSKNLVNLNMLLLKKLQPFINE